MKNKLLSYQQTSCKIKSVGHSDYMELVKHMKYAKFCYHQRNISCQNREMKETKKRKFPTILIAKTKNTVMFQCMVNP